MYRTRRLVKGNYQTSSSNSPLLKLEQNDLVEAKQIFPVLASDVPLSFWGGIDELTGIIIDTSHPLHGKNVHDTILCLPSGRGSCTASQVLLELILNDKAPRALVLRDRDGLVCVGAVIAQTVFPESKVLDIVQVLSIVDEGGNGTTEEDPISFETMLAADPKFGAIQEDGSIVLGATEQDVMERIKEETTAERKSADIVSAQSHVDSLSSEEQTMLANATTEAERRAVECLIQYAHIVMDVPTYIDVEKAHIDGCTYIGPGGLHFVQRLVEEGGHVKIPTTLNSVSTDLRNWEQLGIVATESQQNARLLADAYVQLGCSGQSFTCAPYLLDDPPRKGQQIVWGESNAVVYANTALGARTEKYADYLDICCALVGKVPTVGVHLDESRVPRILLDMSGVTLTSDVHENPDTFSLLFPVLGHLCGSLSDGQVPILVGLEQYADQITPDHLKAFCAAFGTTAASPLIHIAGVTPEAKDPNDIDRLVCHCGNRKVVISSQDLEDRYALLDQYQSQDKSKAATKEKIDWIALGNPHLSLNECDELLQLIERNVPSGGQKHEDVTMIACISRSLYEKSPSVSKLEEFGVTFVNDTCWCMLLHPPMIPSDPEATILTNSGKYAHYGPGLTNRKNFRMGNMKDCVQAAWTGSLARRLPGAGEMPWRRSYSTLALQTKSKASIPFQALNHARMALRFIK
jgi:cis-L-3-hydroxyproline dehydratase